MITFCLILSALYLLMLTGAVVLAIATHHRY